MLWLWVAAIIIIVFGFVVFRGAPYVPSKKRELRQAFKELYPLNEDDLLVDIGSGDGIVLRQAAECGARAVGYELNPILVAISRLISRNQPLVKVNFADFWFVQLPSETTVVYVFGESRDIAKMAQKVAEESTRLGKKISFISYAFVIPNLEYVKKEGAYFLYEFYPLQSSKA